MGRKKTWKIEENEVLAGIWSQASEDLVTATKQPCKILREPINYRSIEFVPGLENILKEDMRQAVR